MRLVLFAAAVVGCGPGLSSAPVVQKSGVREKLLSRDPAVIESLLHGPVVDGGLVFASPECASEFNAAGEVGPTRINAFARCLATLELRPSQREYELDDIVILEYGAGFEVQARFTGPRLTWIGFDARAPVITASQFLSLRKTQDNAVSLPPTLEPYAHAWIDVCVNESGVVDGTQIRETTSPLAAATFEALVKSWRFYPLLVSGKPSPFCTHVRLARGTAPRPEVIPPPVARSRSGAMPIVLGPASFESHRIRGTKNIVPDDVTKSEIAKRHITDASGMFRLCVDETGVTEAVTQLHSTGVPDYDRKIISRMHEWAYRPFEIEGHPVPVCTSVTFHYRQLHGPVVIRH